MNLVLRTVVTAVAVAVAAFFVPGIRVDAPSLVDKAIALGAVAVIIGLVNAIVKPIVKGLTGCLTLVTFGAFLLVINALMLMLSAWIAGKVGIAFTVSGFVPAIFGSIIITVVSAAMNGLLSTERDK